MLELTATDDTATAELATELALLGGTGFEPPPPPPPQAESPRLIKVRARTR